MIFAFVFGGSNCNGFQSAFFFLFSYSRFSVALILFLLSSAMSGMFNALDHILRFLPGFITMEIAEKAAATTFYSLGSDIAIL